MMYKTTHEQAKIVNMFCCVIHWIVNFDEIFCMFMVAPHKIALITKTLVTLKY